MMMKKTIRNEKGIALVIVILLLVALTTLGILAVNVSNIGTKITSNTITTKQAFYLAEAGIERARELLRSNVAGGTTLSAMLTTAANGGTLVNSNTIANFTGTGNTPFVNTTNLGQGSFKVYLTNDSADGVTTTTDNNSIVTLTSFGYGPNNALAVVQITTTKGGVNLPNLPGAITIAGPNCVFDPPNSNAFDVAGGATHPAVAVNSAASYNTITGNSAVQHRSGNYTGTGGSPSVINTTFGAPWDSITDLNKIYTTLKANADFTSPSDPGFTPGTTANRKIVVIDGDYTFGGGTSGAGILLVTGTLTLNGNFSYDGIILCFGKGDIQRNGGGNGNINGGIYVANTLGPDGTINTADDAFGFGAGNISTFDTNGGGNSTISYNAASQTNSAALTNSIPFSKTSWRQY